MKHTFKAFSTLLLLLVLCMYLSSSAFAADSTITYKSKGNWEFSPGSGYTSSDLFDGFKNVMPGDTRTETITINNRASDSDYIKLYLQAILHDEQGNPLSYSKAQAGENAQKDETIASMHDFLSQLTMRVWHRNTLIYEASPDELGGLTDPVLLTILNSGESTSLNVELVVPIEMNNDYAYRVGEVDWMFTVEAFNRTTPPSTPTTLTAHKVWDDGGDENRPESITVRLMRNGEFFSNYSLAEVTLSAANHWTYTWGLLDAAYSWSVEEVVPDGYSAEYKREGNTVHIINSKGSEDPEDPPPPPDNPDNPDDPVDPPVGPVEPVYLTVKKAWSGDEDAVNKRPDSVGITLYNGTEAVETVWLGDWNSWSYTWSNLDGNGNWGILEVVPKGYVPSYSVNGREITVTNTATLIQTGQMNWPVPVLGGLGALLITVGVYIILRKRKNDHA